MLGVAAQRIVHPIRKPRNNADEAIAPKPGWDGAFRAICCVAPLANGAYHWLRVASCISSRKASVATTRDLFRGSLMETRIGIDIGGTFTDLVCLNTTGRVLRAKVLSTPDDYSLGIAAGLETIVGNGGAPVIDYATGTMGAFAIAAALLWVRDPAAGCPSPLGLSP